MLLQWCCTILTCVSLSRHHIIDTAFLDIAQHICEYFLWVSTFRSTMQFNVVLWVFTLEAITV